MKKKFIILIILLYNKFYSQNLYDYKLKDVSNVKDRTKILDVLRSELKKNYNQEFVFVVKKLNVSAGFAWFEGYVRRKDGQDLLLEPSEDNHVNSLLQSRNGQWYIIKKEVFVKDVEWEALFNKNKVLKKIYLY